MDIDGGFSIINQKVAIYMHHSCSKMLPATIIECKYWIILGEEQHEALVVLVNCTSSSKNAKQNPEYPRVSSSSNYKDDVITVFIAKHLILTRFCNFEKMFFPCFKMAFLVSTLGWSETCEANAAFSSTLIS